MFFLKARLWCCFIRRHALLLTTQLCVPNAKKITRFKKRFLLTKQTSPHQITDQCYVAGFNVIYKLLSFYEQYFWRPKRVRAHFHVKVNGQQHILQLEARRASSVLDHKFLFYNINHKNLQKGMWGMSLTIRAFVVS